MTISFMVGFTAAYYDPYHTIKLAASLPSETFVFFIENIFEEKQFNDTFYHLIGRSD